MKMFSGTGNGMAKSLLDAVGEPCTVYNAVLSIIRGCTLGFDILNLCYQFYETLVLLKKVLRHALTIGRP